MAEINYSIILIAAFLSLASPGPATLSIAAVSMNQGRLHGFMLANGIATGGILWSSAAAFGFSAIMYTNVWLFELMRYLGACYLLFLAYNSARSAIKNTDFEIHETRGNTISSTYSKGLLLQLTNPKIILFFGSLYAVAVPSGVDAGALVSVILAISFQSILLFYLLVFLFSTTKFRDIYIGLRRSFDAIFAAFFIFAGFKLLTSKLGENQ